MLSTKPYEGRLVSTYICHFELPCSRNRKYYVPDSVEIGRSRHVFASLGRIQNILYWRGKYPLMRNEVARKSNAKKSLLGSICPRFRLGNLFVTLIRVSRPPTALATL
jgi:hypothetical protein